MTDPTHPFLLPTVGQVFVAFICAGLLWCTVAFWSTLTSIGCSAVIIRGSGGTVTTDAMNTWQCQLKSAVLSTFLVFVVFGILDLSVAAAIGLPQLKTGEGGAGMLRLLGGVVVIGMLWSAIGYWTLLTKSVLQNFVTFTTDWQSLLLASCLLTLLCVFVFGFLQMPVIAALGVGTPAVVAASG